MTSPQGKAEARTGAVAGAAGARADQDEMKFSSLPDMSQLTIRRNRKKRNYAEVRYSNTTWRSRRLKSRRC